MFAVSVCKGCGRTLDNEYFYCPWCGLSRSADSADSESKERMYMRIEEKQRDEQRQKILSMKNRLDELEKELSVLVLSTEMHK